METIELVLDEVRAIRTDLNKHMKDSENRLSTLEAKVKPLIDNGRPGRITQLEKEVDELIQFRWKVGGIQIGLAAVITCAAWLIGILRH